MRNELAAKAYLAALWIVCVYRAATQSVVHDEALTYQLYLAGAPGQMFQLFDANHHFLNTLLMYVCVSLFGVSEWSMRLPALAGAALYFAAVYRLSRYVFGSGYAFLLAVGVATLNPFLLDFMVAARGYGMALALWTWALALLLPYISDPKQRTPRKLAEAAAALALSVVANLIFAVPAAVLAGMVAWLLRKPAPPPVIKTKRKTQARMPVPQPLHVTNAGRGASILACVGSPEDPSLAIYFALPIAAIAVLFILISPVTSAPPGAFYAGSSTIAESLRSLASVSLAHGGPWRNTRPTAWIQDAAAFVLAPAILLAGLALSVRRKSLLLLLGSGVGVGSALALGLAHAVLDLPYPIDRTGIYFPPLVSLVLLGLASTTPSRAGAAAIYAAAGIFLLQFAVEWNVRKFVVWEYDADTKNLANHLSESVANKIPASTRVGCTWQLEPSLNFYRQKNAWTWMQPVTRAPLTGIFDYYALAAWDRPVAANPGLRILYTGPVSGTLLAARQGSN